MRNVYKSNKRFQISTCEFDSYWVWLEGRCLSSGVPLATTVFDDCQTIKRNILYWTTRLKKKILSRIIDNFYSARTKSYHHAKFDTKGTKTNHQQSINFMRLHFNQKSFSWKKSCFWGWNEISESTISYYIKNFKRNINSKKENYSIFRLEILNIFFHSFWFREGFKLNNGE